jgi:hypothetical protein
VMRQNLTECENDSFVCTILSFKHWNVPVVRRYVLYRYIYMAVLSSQVLLRLAMYAEWCLCACIISIICILMVGYTQSLSVSETTIFFVIVISCNLYHK